LILSALTASTGISKSWIWLKGTRRISTCSLFAITSTTRFWSDDSESLACPTLNLSESKLLLNRISSVRASSSLQDATVVPMPWTSALSAMSYRLSCQ
jgi:hypothetical protein